MKVAIVSLKTISLKTVVIYVVALVVVVYMAAPYGWLLVGSFMTEAESLSVPPHFLPQNPTLDNYRAFFDPEARRARAEASRVSTSQAGEPENIPRSILNSAIVASGTAFLALFFGTMAAYSFVRLQFRGSRTLMTSYLLTRMVPGVCLIVPIFVAVQAMHLVDTLIALIMLETAGVLPISVWILASYFQTIPRDLEDAARVDRCGWVRMMLRVFLPLAVPALAAVGIAVFIWSWQSFLVALIITSTMASKTAPVVISEFVTVVAIDWSLMFTAGVLAVLPPVLLALLFQRLIIQGLVAGALKG